MDIRNIITHIDDAFRPQTYWGWHEYMRDGESEFQIREMKKAGLGGYVAHARGGLEVPYMGDEWCSSVHVSIETGRELGMIFIIDDEHGWPSGFAGGAVNGRGQHYHQKYLKCEEKKGAEIKVGPETLGVYRLLENEMEVLDLNKVLPHETLVHIFFTASPYYTDLADPNVTQAFIEEAYEPYARLCGEHFGRGVWGVFSDEPQLARENMHWSFALPAAFLSRFGYNLSDYLPCLFYDNISGYKKVRYDYYATLSDMFSLNYAKPIRDWCEKRGLVFTGHTTCEDDFRYQISCSGDTMPFYEYFTIPGIDWLGRTAPSVLTIKQLTSVSAQLNKKRVLSEMFGCSGWNVSFEELRWIGVGQIMYGIDLMVQHIGLYSLKGSRKREFPASLFYQQPWWEQFSHFNDYFARMCKLVHISKERINTLVIHPIETAWTLKNEHSPATLNVFTKEYVAFLEKLLLLGINYDLGNCTIMQRHGAVSGDKVIVGQCTYYTVIIPECGDIAPSTVDLLYDFAVSGGKLIAIGTFPATSGGKPSEKLFDLYHRCIKVENCPATLESELPDLCGADVRIIMDGGESNNDIHLSSRECNGEIFHILYNTLQTAECTFSLSGITNPCAVLSLENMLYSSICLDHIKLAPMQCLLIVENQSADYQALPADRPSKSIEIQSFNIKAPPVNVLTIDSCAYSIDGGDLKPPIFVTQLQKKLLKSGLDCDVQMIFTFETDYLPEGELYLVVEQPEKCSVTLNGKQVPSESKGYWLDKSFEKLDISGMVMAGRNEISVNRRFANEQYIYDIINGVDVHEAELNRTTVQTELEAVYLLGNFSVRFDGNYTPAENNSFFAKGRFIVTSPISVTNGISLTKDGYPFFSGKITLSADIEIDMEKGKRITLDINRPECIVSTLSLNDVAFESMWAPYEYDITDIVKHGNNKVCITLYTSNRNTLGPLHHNLGEPYSVGPASYVKNQKPDLDLFALVNFGLSGGVRIHYYDV